MTPQKRLLDLTLVILLSPFLLPILAALVLVVWLREGRPILYSSERMQSPTRSFLLWKLRTMRTASEDSGVTGGDKSARITPTGQILRKRRLDELPQIFNILCGDISFVGPRPPLRVYVERFPEIYQKVLQSRPGVTGLASLVYARHEAHLLARCESAEETDAIYARACIPRKARLDLIYQRNQSLLLDVWLVFLTAARLFGFAQGRRLPRKQHSVTLTQPNSQPSAPSP
ncbi:sugar transferase [Seohaeicola saemankumensis]|uniref:sugar transferase n=1 Tax=Seohaeicola TaxID=481178 RepID=UPI0035D0D367